MVMCSVHMTDSDAHSAVVTHPAEGDAHTVDRLAVKSLSPMHKG
jgi:hypothetical protein